MMRAEHTAHGECDERGMTMGWQTYTYWTDDDVIATSDDGTLRVVLRPDTDAELDGDVYPILVRVSGACVESCAGERWYHPSADTFGEDDDFARAVDYFYLGSRTWRDGTVHRPSYMARLTRWVRLFLGGTTVAQVDRNGDTFFACDSAALRKSWGLHPGRALGEDELTCDIPDFLDGEAYGYVVQERRCIDCEDDCGHEWIDTDEMRWGLIGREWAEDEAGEALAAYTLRDGKIVEDQP